MMFIGFGIPFPKTYLAPVYSAGIRTPRLTASSGVSGQCLYDHACNLVSELSQKRRLSEVRAAPHPSLFPFLSVGVAETSWGRVDGASYSYSSYIASVESL